MQSLRAAPAAVPARWRRITAAEEPGACALARSLATASGHDVLHSAASRVERPVAQRVRVPGEEPAQARPERLELRRLAAARRPVALRFRARPAAVPAVEVVEHMVAE